MLSSLGLKKHHTQGTPNMGKELNIHIFILVQYTSVYLKEIYSCYPTAAE